MGMDRLIEKITAYGNPTVAGLDPKLSYIPQYIRDAFFRNSRIRPRRRQNA